MTSSDDEGGWHVRIVQASDGVAVWSLSVTARQWVRWRRVALVVAVAMASLIGLLGVTLPRSLAASGLVEENLALKVRLQDIEHRMTEVDQVLLRLRTYDAQLRSLSEPEGDHGGRAPLEPPTVEHDPFGELWSRQLPAERGTVSAADYADGLMWRADAFLVSLASLEPAMNERMAGWEGLAALERALPSVWPADGQLTSGYGWRKNPFGYRWKFHSGIDIARRRGVPIRATAAGVVTRAEFDTGYGRVVEIDHGLGITTRYAHCHRLSVGLGDLVEAGDVLGTMGSTGHSTGPHLHFEMLVDGSPVDPMPYMPEGPPPG